MRRGNHVGVCLFSGRHSAPPKRLKSADILWYSEKCQELGANSPTSSGRFGDGAITVVSVAAAA